MSDYAWLVEEEKEKDSEKSSSKNTDKKDSKDDDVKLRDIDATTLSIFQRAHSMFPTAQNEIEALVKLIQYELEKDDEEMEELKNELDSKLKDVERLKNKEQSDIKGVKNLLKQDDVELDYIHSELAAIKQFLSNVEQRLSQRNQQKESKDTGDRYPFLELTESSADSLNKYSFLREAFTEPYPYTDTTTKPNKFWSANASYQFETENGLIYHVAFDNSTTESYDSYNLEFWQETDKKRIDITKTGDAYRIFATVIDILKRFINEYGPELIEFTAHQSETSRIKLYKRMINSIDKVFSNFKSESHQEKSLYVFTIRNESINEGVGRITKYNQTADVGPNEIKKQASKYGFDVNKDGYPPLLTSTSKNKKKRRQKTADPNTMWNLGLTETYAFLRDGIEKPKKHLIDLSFYGSWFNPKEGLILNVDDYQHASTILEYFTTQSLEGNNDLTPNDLEEFNETDLIEYAFNAGFVRLVHENNEPGTGNSDYFIIQGNLENVRNGWHLIRKALREHNPRRLMIETYGPRQFVDIWNDEGPVFKSKKYNTFVRKYIKNIKEDITEDLETSTYGSWYNSHTGNVIPVGRFRHKEVMEEYLLNKRILDEDDEIVIIGDDVYDLNLVGIYGAAFMLGFVRLVHEGDTLEIHGKVKDIKRSWKALYNFIRANDFNRIYVDFTDNSNWLNTGKNEEEEWKNNREFQNINKFMKGKVSEDYSFIREDQLEKLGLHSKFWYNTFTKKVINVDKNEHHSHTIINNPELFGLEISPDRPKRLYDANLVKEATEQGWARCVYHKQRFDVEAFNIKETRRATKFVLNNGLSINNLHVETTSDGAYYKITSEINVEKFVKTGKTSFVESKLLKEYVINSEIDTSHYGSWYNPKENIVLPVDFQEHADTIQEYLRGENLYRREPDKEYAELFVNGEWIQAPGSQYTRGFALGFVRLLHYRGAFEIRGKYEDVALAWKALRKTIRAGDYNTIAIDMDDQWAIIRKKEYERWSDKKAFKVLNKKLISGENIKDVNYITEDVISEQDYNLPYKFWMDPYENRIIPVLSPYVHHQDMAINELDSFSLPKEDEQRIYELTADFNEENETYHMEIMYLIMRNGWVRGIKEDDRTVSLEYQNPKDARKALALITKRGVDLERVYLDHRQNPKSEFSETKILSDLEIDRFIRYGKLDEGIEYVDNYPVYTNPTPSLLAKMLSDGKTVRGLMVNEKIYLWDAYNATHHSTIHNLGLSDQMDDAILLMFYNAKERDLDAHVLLAELGFSGDFVTKEIYNSPAIKRLISKTQIPVKYKRMGRLLDESVKPYKTSDDHTIMMIKNPTISNLRNFIFNLSKKEKDIVEDDLAEVRGIVHDGNVYFTNPIRADHRDMFDALFVNMTHDMWINQTFYIMLNLKTNALYFTSKDTDSSPQKYTNVMLRDKLKALRKKYPPLIDRSVANEAVEKATTTSGKEITVYRNPTSRVAEKLLKEYTGTRGLYADGNIWLWDAYEAIHYDIQRALGISNAVQFYITFGNRGKPYGIGITKGGIDISPNELLEFPRIQKVFSRVNLQPIEGDILDESFTNENVQWATGENLEHAKGWSQKDQLSGKYDVVWVDIEELFNRTDPGERLDIHHELGGKHHIGDRVARAKEFWQAGKYMDPSTISVMPGGTVRFGDGRHRLVAAYQLGEKYAPVIVPKNEVKYLEGILKENIELGPEHLEEIEGWWITPEGDIFDTEDYMGAHAVSLVDWSRQNRESMFDAFNQMAHDVGYYDDYYHPENNEVADGSKGDIMDYASYYEFEVSNFAKERGFIRVVLYKKMIEFDMIKPSKKATLTALKFAKINEHLFEKFSIEMGTVYKRYDTFNDLQRSLRSLKIKESTSYSFLREGINVDDLSADVYGFWVNVKTGQIIPVQDDFHHEKTMRAYTKNLGLTIPHDKIYQWAYDNDFVRLTKRNTNLYVQGTFRNVKDFWNKALRKVYNDYSRIAFDLYKHNPGHYVLHTDDRQEFNKFIRLMKTGKAE